MYRHFSPVLAIATMVSVLLVLIPPAHAQFGSTKTWDPQSPTADDWHNNNNWSPFGVPTIDDAVEILIDDQVVLTDDTASGFGGSTDGIDSLLLENGAELSTNGHRLNTYDELAIGLREDFTTIRGAGSTLRVASGGDPNDFETLELNLEDGGQLLLEGGGVELGGNFAFGGDALSIDATSALVGNGTLHVDDNVSYSGTIDVEGQATIDGELVNSGTFRIAGQGEVTGALDNQVDGELIVDNTDNSSTSVLTLNDVVENFGTIEIASQVEQDSELDLTAAVPTVLNREGGTLRLTGPDDLDGDGQIAGRRIIGGNVSNLGTLEIQANTQIEGQLGVGLNAQALVDDAEVCCEMTVEVDGGVLNAGTFDMISADKGVTIELGAGEVFDNQDSGVVNLENETTSGSPPLEGIVGDVVNNGQFNIRTNVQIDGSLENAFNAETVIDNADACCSITVDVEDGITNHGTINVTSREQGVTLELGEGQSLQNDASGVVTFDNQTTSGAPPSEAIVGDVLNNGQFNIRTNVQIDGALENAFDAETVIDNIEDCCNITVDVEDGITNSGVLRMTSSNEQGPRLEMGAGQALTNETSGVINLQDETDGGEPPFEGIVGNVVNDGKINIQTNAEIDGLLDNRVGGETAIHGVDDDIVVDATRGVTNGGTLTLTSTDDNLVTLGAPPGEAITNETGGLLRGVGTIDGNLANSGTIEPGSSTGLLTVSGDFTQDADGMLMIEATGTTAGEDYDQLAVGGDVSLDGVVQLLLDDGFVPAAGDAFEVITSAASVDGQFSDAFLPGLPEGMNWLEDYQGDSFMLRVVEELAGDYNGNGIVDAADYTVWRDNLGSPDALPNDDTPGVGPDDYDRWVNHFGMTAGSGSAGASPSQAAVPEPPILWLLSLGCVMVGILRRAD